MIGQSNPMAIKLFGRVVGVRIVGKLKFYDVMRDHKITQFTTTSEVPVARGDFVAATGTESPTKDGLCGVRGDHIEIVNKFKGVHFPDKKMGINCADRHIDLLSNTDSNLTFRERARIIQKLRNYLDSRGFLEVETPILSECANGANARPFKTMSASCEEFYLRIAPELYLKRLIIGGFDRVYEIGRVFRNEGCDSSHNPEFTSMELYQSFGTFSELLAVVKEILGLFDGCSIAQVLNIMQILKQNNIPLDLSMNIREQLEHFTKQYSLFEPGRTNTKLFDRLVKRFVEPLCTVPTILTHFPLFTSPLAAASKADPLIADRLEAYIDQMEIANGYQELTDPDEQALRFQHQLSDRQSGDQDSPLPDAEYVETLRMGMPPTIGLGIGIDRLVMLLTKKKSIKNVILFPR